MIEVENVRPWVESLTYKPGWRFVLIEPAFDDPELKMGGVLGRLMIYAEVPNSWYPHASTQRMSVVAAGCDIYEWYEPEQLKMIVEDEIDRLDLHERKEWLKAAGKLLTEPHELDGAFTKGRH